MKRSVQTKGGEQTDGGGKVGHLHKSLVYEKEAGAIGVQVGARIGAFEGDKSGPLERTACVHNHEARAPSGS
ncbi:hypothetical protein DB346_23020 [Verrucomicrobia bacterium LW23]|nr:hypothetical protein DB346_23020 [Verrucomicrobia bacterium LW23]